jgi:hypothetical protein
VLAPERATHFTTALVVLRHMRFPELVAPVHCKGAATNVQRQSPKPYWQASTIQGDVLQAASELQPRAATVEDDSASFSVEFITEKPIVTIRGHDAYTRHILSV